MPPVRVPSIPTVGVKGRAVSSAGAAASAPIAFDANLGSQAFNAAAATSRSLTTTSNAAPNSKIIAGIMCFDLAAVVSAPSSGGLTWRVARNYQGANFTIALVEADCPGGWTSGTAIVFPTTSAGGGAMWAMSFTGIAAGAATATAVSGAGSPYSSSLSVAGDALLVSMTAAFADGSAGNVYNTPTGGAIEVHDFGDPGGPVACATSYKATTGAGTQTITGTVAIGAGFNQQIGAAFLKG